MAELESDINEKNKIHDHFKRFRRPAGAAMLALYGGFVIVQTVRIDGADRDYADTFGGVGFGLGIEVGAAAIAFPDKRRAIINGSLEKAGKRLMPLADRLANGIGRIADNLVPDTNSQDSAALPSMDSAITLDDPSDSPIDNLQSTPPFVELQESTSFSLPQTDGVRLAPGVYDVTYRGDPRYGGQEIEFPGGEKASHAPRG